MNFINKYLIIIITVFILAIFLPSTYEKMFSKRGEFVRISYSPVKEDFVKIVYPTGSNRSPKYSNIDSSEEYTREDYEVLLPFQFYSDLTRWGTFPKKFASFEKNSSIIRSSQQFAFVRQNDVNKKSVGLYPLIESASKFSSLELPNELFRLNNGIEFINILKNEINQEKSDLFTEEFKKHNISFPIKNIYGNQTIRKPFDEGYFLVDNKDELFHFKMIEGKAYIKQIELNGIKVKYMSLTENQRVEFYGLLLGENKKLYLLMYEDYEILALPIKEYDYRTSSFSLSTDPLYRHITIEQKNYKTEEQIIKTYITDLDYELIDENIYKTSFKNNKTYENIQNILFPFNISMTNSESHSYYPSINDISLLSYSLNIIFLILYFLFIKKTKRQVKEHLTNSILILFLGTYALIAISAFSKVLYTKEKK